MNSKFISSSQQYQIKRQQNRYEDENSYPVNSSSSFIKKCQSTLPSTQYRQNQNHIHKSTCANQYETPVVQNICNQIKFLIQGNLKSNNPQINTIDFVRDNIIPMLIKMFFQSSIKQNDIDYHMNNTSEQFKDVTNNLGTKIRHWNSVTSMKSHNLEQFNQTSKSAFIPQAQDNQIDQHQNVEQGQINEPILTKTLCLSILLLKTLIIQKSQIFNKIKLFSKHKQKVLKQFVFLFKQAQVSKCTKTFQRNRIQQKTNKIESQLTNQMKLFNQKRMSLSLQVICKIMRINIKGSFNVFKQNCFKQNKWMNLWIKNAALKSLLTVKTSIWRLKQFLINSQNQQQNCFNIQFPDKANQSLSQRKQKQKKCYNLQKHANKQQQEQSQQQQQSISSNQFDKMFQNQQNIEPLTSINKIQTKNQANSSINQQFEKQQDEYLITISQDEHESSLNNQ